MEQFAVAGVPHRVYSSVEGLVDDFGGTRAAEGARRRKRLYQDIWRWLPQRSLVAATCGHCVMYLCGQLSNNGALVCCGPVGS